MEIINNILELEIINSISYVLQFIDSARFMASSLTNIANNLSEGVDKIKCKFENNDDKSETSRIKYKYCDYFLGYPDFKDDLIKYQYLCYNKNYQDKFVEKFKERFYNTYTFSNHNNSKFILLLRKVVYSYEYMDDREKSNVTLLQSPKYGRYY